MKKINDPHDCLDRLFLANIIPAPIPSDQLSIRWIDLIEVACRLLDRIEALENQVAALKGADHETET